MIVEVAFEFVKIGEINTMNETFQAEIVIESKWETTEDLTIYDPKKHWNPNLYIDNAINIKEMLRYEVSLKDKTKIITEFRSIKGQFWERIDLQHFPFDIQTLELVLTSKLGSEKLCLVTDAHKLSYIHIEAKKKFKDQQKWQLFRFVTTSDSTCYDKEVSKNIAVEEIISARKNLKPPKLVASCYSARRPGFYLINAFFLIFLITLVSFTVFSIDINSPQFRLQGMFTILLSAISLKWAILKRLPCISYLTLLDQYQISSIAFICLIATWHAVQASFFNEHMLDSTMMIFFLLLFIFIHIFFCIWIYCINKRKRELLKEERAYFSKYKELFMPNGSA